jgi:hypothetical protein
LGSHPNSGHLFVRQPELVPPFGRLLELSMMITAAVIAMIASQRGFSFMGGISNFSRLM